MGPRAHQSALLIREMRKLDLQGALARARAPSENFEDQSRAVDYFRVPRLLQIALLNRRKRTIHDHDRRRHAFCKPGDFINLALANIGRRSNFAERHQSGFDDCQIDSARKPDGFLKTRFRRTGVRGQAAAASGRRLLEPRLDDNRPTGLDTRCGRAQTIGTLVATAYFQLGFISGRRLVGPFEALDRMTRHDGRNRMLVYELGMSISSQQHAEVIEPGHDALQLDTVHQKNCERYFTFADVIEKCVLQVLRTIGGHGRFSIFCSRLARETFFAQVLPHALRTCAALPLAKRSGAPGVALLDGSYLSGASRSWRARP